MNSVLDCIPCFIRQSIEAARLITNDEIIIERCIRKILQAASDFDLSNSPPVMGQIIHKIIRNEVNSIDPYKDIKKSSIKKALLFKTEAKMEIIDSEFPFLTAIKYSIAGNIFDFALLSDLNDYRIKITFLDALKKEIDNVLVNELYGIIKKAKTVLVLGDNAGESVFDKLLIETFPGFAVVFYAVKESPIINDAVYEDAVNSGLEEVAGIISNGYNAPGTIIDKCSNEFLNIFNSADVVIAKGQGNLETLIDSKREIYFLTQIKCPVIAERSKFTLGDWVITKTSLLGVNTKGEN